ncbi:MFS transporter [Phycisphaera mikurensis]|uniref:Major facilitator superfamily protein n=1 Tax=Phycisphaera mikurensis (strain NBRC 102666 / KCTC 22515 / FYK2301M01) TaxID=1142394 RepID=I0IHI5_PHYMF|nr:MFS transporter [Phycisphaera mikurensis]MBB6440969.1 1-acyl-sn-glycerol-3-phosphate acyltransferase [Phycisphaera mikurensis]BAM04723.1 major facilitator superfamily protein [Phycisphaera mikurensis NBRC 102666]
MFTKPLTPLWRNLSFTLMWTSTAASGFGDRMMMVAALALLGALGAASESTALNAGTQFWFFLPYLFFSLPAGWLSDHLPRKWVMFFCDESRAAILFLGFWLIPPDLTTGGIPLEDHWKVMGVLFLVGTAASFFNPARSSIVPQVVAPKQLQAGNAILLSISVIASMIGLVVGGYLIDPDEGSTVKNGLWLAFLLYAVSGTFFTFMRVKDPVVEDPDEPREKRTLMQAARYIRSHPKLIRLMGLHAIVWAGAMIVYSAVLAVGKINFELSGNDLLEHFAWMGPVLGFGMLVGAILVGLIRTRREVVLPMMLSLLLAGLCVTVVAFVKVYWLALLCSFLLGLFGNITIISALTLLQSITPNYIRGRVMGLDSMSSTAMSVIVSAIVYQMPDADRNILTVMYFVGPVMFLIGLVQLVRHMKSGRMDSAAANVFRRIERWFCLVWHRLEWTDLHRVPRTGGVILASNHTTALDPFLLQAAVPRPIRWLMLTSYRFRAFEPLWRTIDPVFLEVDPASDEVAPGPAQVRDLAKRLRGGDLVGVFPEGHLQYESRELDTFQEGAAALSRLSGAVIVPCFISGTPRSRSMITHLFKPTHSRIAFGEGFVVSRGDDVAAATASLRAAIEQLAAEEAERAEGRGRRRFRRRKKLDAE